MSDKVLELSAAELVFYGELQLQGSLVTVSEDKQTVTIDGVPRGTFEDMKSIFVDEWNASVDAVTKSATKFSGISYTNANGSVVCSATNNDQLTVTNTLSMMGASAGQTDIDMQFSNGNILVLIDDADLAAFIAIWGPFRKANSQTVDSTSGRTGGYSYEEVEV